MQRTSWRMHDGQQNILAPPINSSGTHVNCQQKSNNWRHFDKFCFYRSFESDVLLVSYSWPCCSDLHVTSLISFLRCRNISRNRCNQLLRPSLFRGSTTLRNSLPQVPPFKTQGLLLAIRNNINHARIGSVGENQRRLMNSLFF